jgi:hypothetical protein
VDGARADEGEAGERLAEDVGGGDCHGGQSRWRAVEPERFRWNRGSTQMNADHDG